MLLSSTISSPYVGINLSYDEEEEQDAGHCMDFRTAFSADLPTPSG